MCSNYMKDFHSKMYINKKLQRRDLQQKGSLKINVMTIILFKMQLYNLDKLLHLMQQLNTIQ